MIASNDGVNIYYEHAGTGDPLILIMGFGADGSLWSQHVEAYQKHFTCYMIDNRGVGKSDQPPGPYSTALMASDVKAVMDQEGIEQARVAGISMGGAIAQQLAIRYPAYVSALALISTWPRFNMYAKTVYENLKKLRVTTSPDTFMELLQLWIFAPPYYEKHLEELKEGQIAAKANTQPQSRDGFEGQLDACIQHDVVNDLDKIKIPTIITVGDNDIFTPPSFSKILHDRIEGSEFVSFPDAGHVHHWEDLERFNAITTDFFLNNG